MKKERTGPAPALGGSSLLTIFGVLCLTVLALLSLSTVQAQSRLTDSAVEAVSAYYAADLEAEKIFARLRAGEQPEGVGKTEEGYAYTCPISQSQTLYVELKEEAGTWTVLRWQAVAEELEIEETLSVWDGQ